MTNFNLNKTLLMPVMMGFLVSCSGGGPTVINKRDLGKKSTQAEVLVAPKPTTEATMPEKVDGLVSIAIPSALIGVWEEECKVVSDSSEDAGSLSYNAVIVINADHTLTVSTNVYNGYKCKDKSILQQYRVTASFELYKEMLVANKNLKTFVTYYDQESIVSNNLSKTCGLDDWKYAQEHVDCSVEQSGSSLGGQYKIENGKLYLFSCDSKSDEDCSPGIYTRRL